MVFALAVLVVAPALADGTTKVGDFLIRLAEFKNLHPADSRMAAGALTRVGIDVPGDLDHDAVLTEGEVTRLSRLAGVNVTTRTPGRIFNADQVERFFASFADELAASDAATRECTHPSGDCSNPGNPYPDPQAPFDPFSKGKGKNKGKGKGGMTPTEPE
jgi:hypothetical protein